jgi:hypothetical protein
MTASCNPGARFVALDGRNHTLVARNPAWPRFVTEARGFLDDSPRTIACTNHPDADAGTDS